MANLRFFKMQGTGNDFILIDNRELNLSEKEIIKLTPKLCNRRYGIGADGLLVMQPPDGPSLDYSMFYRNADGSDAGMCGNGARCLALFANQTGFDENLRFNIHQNVYQAQVIPDDNYVWIQFPMQVEVQEVELKGEPPLLQANTGTEHVAQFVSDELFAQNDELRKRGRYLRNHQRFEPKGTNVNFICSNEKNGISLKTYERGVENLTLACGTGAIASGLIWHWQQSRSEGNQEISVQTDGGLLNVKFHYDSKDDSYSGIELGGEAQLVFEGKYPL